MSANAAIDVINDALNPFLHQVTGSTPASIRDMIKAANVNSNQATGIKLATVALFAASVNKTTLESFVATATMGDIRAVLSNQFSISGKVNMSALSLFGHCILTSDFISSANYAKAFRDRLGMRHIWERELQKDRLSDEQFKIFTDKKKKTPENEAANLGIGYFKFIGVDKEPMSASESEFWGLQQTRTLRAQPSDQPSLASAATGRDPFESPDTSPKRQQVASRARMTYSDNSQLTKTASIDQRAIDYFKGTISKDDAELRLRLAKYGPEEFERKMLKGYAADPEMKNRPQGSTIQ